MTTKREALPPPSMRGHYAGFVTRYVAFLVDVVLIVVVLFLLAAVTRITLTFFGLEQLLTQIQDAIGLNRQEPLLGPVARWLLTILVSFFIFGLYSFIAWLLVGKTVGKALMGLRVLADDGGRVTAKKALIRVFSYYISGLVFLLGFLWVLVDDRRQAWHDRLARTVVVYEWDARYEERYVAALDGLKAAQERRRLEREQAVREAVEEGQGGVVDNG